VADVWISNASPIIALSQIRRFDLMEGLASEISFPPWSSRRSRRATVATGRQIRFGPRRSRESSPTSTYLRRWRSGKSVPARARFWVGPSESPERLRFWTTGPPAGAPHCWVSPSLGRWALWRLPRGLVSAAAPIFTALEEAGLFLSKALIRQVLTDLGEAPGESSP
jgi:hypothetical protein